MADYTIVGAEVKAIGTPQADTRLVGTGLSVVQGEVLYVDPATDTWLKTRASGTVEQAQATHIALTASNDGQALTAAVIQRGLVLDLGFSASIPATALVFVSINPGRMAPPTDLSTGHFSTYLGTGIGNNQVLFNVNPSGAAVP